MQAVERVSKREKMIAKAELTPRRFDLYYSYEPPMEAFDIQWPILAEAKTCKAAKSPFVHGSSRA